MEASDRTRPTPQTEHRPHPWCLEPKPKEAPRQEAAGPRDEVPMEEPGYGHGV